MDINVDMNIEIKPDMWMFTQVLKRITSNKKSPVLLRDSSNFTTKQVPWNYDKYCVSLIIRDIVVL